MKSGREFVHERERDTVRKAAKLDPIRRSGKERHTLYKSINSDDDDLQIIEPVKRESVLDYFDDDDQ